MNQFDQYQPWYKTESFRKIITLGGNRIIS